MGYILLTIVNINQIKILKLVRPSITFQIVHTFTSAFLVLITVQRLLKILLAEWKHSLDQITLS